MRGLLLCSLLIPSVAMAQDGDGDGVMDGADNCPSIANADQADANSDGYGDACVSETASLGAGVVIAPGATIAEGATIGSAANLAATARVESYASVGQHAVLQGNTLIATRAILGGASVPPPGVSAPVFGFGSILSRQATLGDDFSVADDNLYGRSVVIGDRLTAANGVNVGYGTTLGDDADLGLNATIGSLATLGDSVSMGDMAVLARGVQVGNGTSFGNGAVIGPNAQFGDNVQVEDNVRIRKDVVVGTDAVIEEGARVGRNVEVQAGATVGEGANVGTGSTILAGSVVPPDEVIPRNTIYGNAVEVCTDGADNDGNGLADCQDSACSGHPSCGEDCTDGIDNDGNGDTDCLDASCIAEPTCASIGFQSGVAYLSSRMTREIRGSGVTSYTTSGGAMGSCAGHPSRPVPFSGTYTARPYHFMIAYSVVGDITVNQASPSGAMSQVTCDWTLGSAQFRGGDGAMDRAYPIYMGTVNAFGGYIEPGCGITDLNDVLPNTLGVNFQNASNVGESSSYAGQAELTWDGNPWYMAAGDATGAGFVGQNNFYGGNGDDPQGPCGDLPYANGPAGSHSYNWGPGCQCTGTVFREVNSANFDIYGNPTTVPINVP